MPHGIYPDCLRWSVLSGSRSWTVMKRLPCLMRTPCFLAMSLEDDCQDMGLDSLLSQSIFFPCFVSFSLPTWARPFKIKQVLAKKKKEWVHNHSHFSIQAGWRDVAVKPMWVTGWSLLSLSQRHVLMRQRTAIMHGWCQNIRELIPLSKLRNFSCYTVHQKYWCPSRMGKNTQLHIVS